MSPNLLIQSVGCVIGLSLFAVGVTSASLLIVGFGAWILAFVGGWHLWLCFSQRRVFWSLCDVHGAAILLSYFAGAAVTLWLSEGGVIAFWSAPDLGTMLTATIYVVAFCAVLRLFAVLERPSWRKLWQSERPNERWPTYLVPGLVALCTLQLYMLLTGVITYAGTGTFDGWKVPYLAGAVVALSWPMMGVCGWVFGKAELRKLKPLFYTCCALFPAQLLFNIGYGRRIVLYQGLVFLVMFIWARQRGFHVRQIVALGVVGLPVIYVLWMVFLGLRVDSYAEHRAYGVQPDYTDRSIFERLNSTVSLLNNNWDGLQQRQAEDLVNRVFVIGYLTDLFDGTRASSPLYGALLLSDALTSVPRMVFPGKAELVASISKGEDTINRNFGLVNVDRASSVVTAAYADFLWLGILVYPPLIMFLGIAVAHIAMIGRSAFIRVFTASYFLFNALQVEESFFTAKLNMTRAVLAIALIVFAIEFLSRGVRQPYRVTARDASRHEAAMR